MMGEYRNSMTELFNFVSSLFSFHPLPSKVEEQELLSGGDQDDFLMMEEAKDFYVPSSTLALENRLKRDKVIESQFRSFGKRWKEAPFPFHPRSALSFSSDDAIKDPPLPFLENHPE
ncbi:hypothetical protein CDAR_48821 [Caerostris darwini]|uniref:Uncharacterized protein n=1 Tax=Caerostris darwini TaxID=1538125 RepID=A0AAV4NK04_9ARAC|nr:hypothetical protein CDAR_48821 [Caerostris darwini]